MSPDAFLSQRTLLYQEYMRQNISKNPLEPFLVKVACDFTDSADLTHRLQSIYRVRMSLPAQMTFRTFI